MFMARVAPGILIHENLYTALNILCETLLLILTPNQSLRVVSIAIRVDNLGCAEIIRSVWIICK